MSRKIFKTKDNFAKIIQRAKMCHEIQTDTKFAEFLGVTRQNLSEWKRNGSLKLIEAVREKCNPDKVEWILIGDKEAAEDHTDEGRRAAAFFDGIEDEATRLRLYAALLDAYKSLSD